MILRKKKAGFFPSLAGVALLFLGAASAGGIFGCAMGVEGEKVLQAPEKVASEKAPSPKKETTLQEQPFRIEELSVREEQGQTALLLKFSNPVTQYRHFPLAQPSRVVLDVFGGSERMAQVETFRVNTHWVETLRVSSSEGYLRIVTDIAGAKVPAYVIEPEKGGLKVVIGAVAPAAMVKREFQLVHEGKRVGINVAGIKSSFPDVSSTITTAQGEKRYTGQRISLDFKDADIKNVFRLLAEVSGLNIVVTDEVQKRVTVRLVDVPWDQALDLLIDTNGLGKEQAGNVLRISTVGQLRRESDDRRAATTAQELAEPLQTAFLTVNYAKPKDLVDNVLSKIKTTLSPRGSIAPDDNSNTIVVRDIKKRIDDAIAIVSRLDVRIPQILIESNLIETTPTFARALGMELSFDRSNATINSSFPAGLPAGSTPFVNIVRNRFGGLANLNAALTAAEKEGNVKIISRPSVVTLNNKESTVQSLRIIRIALPASNNTAVGTASSAGAAIATERINVGITLTVMPQVSSDGFVLMKIGVKSSTIADSPTVAPSTTGAGSQVIPFDELSREANSNVLVRDGETIVIGGILRDTKSTSESGIPWLKDVPFLGWAFKNMRWEKDFEELMVFITPRVVGGGSENLPAAEQLWRDQLRKTDGG